MVRSWASVTGHQETAGRAAARRSCRRREPPSRHERERRSATERFRDARQTHVIVDPYRPLQPQFRDSGGEYLDRLAPGDHDGDAGRTTLVCHETLQRALQRAIVLIPGERGLDAECQERTDGARDEESGKERIRMRISLYPRRLADLITAELHVGSVHSLFFGPNRPAIAGRIGRFMYHAMFACATALAAACAGSTPSNPRCGQ